MLSLALLPLLAAPQDADSGRTAFTWPRGPVGEALAVVRADTEPEPFEEPLWPRDLSDPAWRDADPWGAWAALVAAERDAEAPDPGRRARLALFALEQRRDPAAWKHLARAAERPGLVAAVLPRFFPGVPRGTAVARGGLPAPLSAGVVLRPALPPPVDEDPWSLLETRAIGVDGVVVGDATLRLRLTVVDDGVDLRATRLAGGETEFAVAMPTPPAFAPLAEYADWERVDTLGEPLPVRPTAVDAEPWRLWVRLRRVPLGWPEALPAALPPALAEAGLELVVAPDDPAAPALAAAAPALAGLLDLPVAVVDRAPLEPPPGLAPVRVDLRPHPQRGRRLARLLDFVEAWCLREARAGG